jgi:hypothetical protein
MFWQFACAAVFSCSLGWVSFGVWIGGSSEMVSEFGWVFTFGFDDLQLLFSIFLFQVAY